MKEKETLQNELENCLALKETFLDLCKRFFFFYLCFAFQAQSVFLYSCATICRSCGYS